VAVEADAVAGRSVCGARIARGRGGTAHRGGGRAAGGNGTAGGYGGPLPGGLFHNDNVPHKRERVITNPLIPRENNYQYGSTVTCKTLHEHTKLP
jgi:hypothetical protein